MKKKRIALIMSINILALVVLTMVMAVSASEADTPANMETMLAAPPILAPGDPISVTILNTSEFPPYGAFQNGIPVYYDQNNTPDQVPYFGGGWIGLNICNDQGVDQDVRVQLYEDDPGNVIKPFKPFKPYSSTLSQTNQFMLGKNQEYSVTVPNIPAGACQISYQYIFTPRFKVDPAGKCHINKGGSINLCTEKEFYVKVTPSTFGAVRTLTGTLVMDGVIAANPGALEFTEKSTNIFTLTVFFDSGNLCTGAGSCAGTFAPTTYYDYDAGVMHLIRIGTIATATTGLKYLTNTMRLEGGGEFTLTNDKIRFIYVFARDQSNNVEFHPSYAANSGSTNYKGGAYVVGVPTAITLSDLRTVTNQPQAILVVGVFLLLGAATVVALRRRPQRE